MIKSIKRFIVKVIFLALACGGLYYFTNASQALAALFPEPEIIEKVVEIVVPRRDFAELMEDAPHEYGISKPILDILVAKESGGNMASIRFEPGHMKRAAKFSSNKEQQRMYASSHCALQVMGWWAPKFDLRWSDLYDPATCMRVGTTIFKDCLSRHKEEKTNVAQIQKAATCYNGSKEYGKDFVKRLGAYLINNGLS